MKRSKRDTVSLVWSFVRGDAKKMALYLALLLVLAILSVLPAILFGKIIDAGIRSGSRSVVMQLGAFTVGIAVAIATLTVVTGWLSAHIAESITYRARVRIFDHVRRLPLSFSTHSDTGALVNRVLNDVAGIQSMTETLAMVLTSGVTGLFVLGAMITVDWHVTLFALGMFPMFYGPARWASSAMMRQHRERSDSAAGLATITTELVSPGGGLLARLHSSPDRDVEGFALRADRLRTAGVRLVLLNNLFIGCLALMTAGGTAGVFWLGSLGVTSGALTIGGLVALATLTGQLYASWTRLAGAPVDLTAAAVSLSRVFEVLDIERPQEGTGTLPSGRGRVDLRDVHFTYPQRETASVPSLQGAITAGPTQLDREVLHGVSLEVPPGTTTAIVGPSGAGKSTVAMLIAGIYPPSSGEVRLDGVDVRTISPAALSGAVGVVSQDTFLLHDTVRANLLYACPTASEQDLVRASRAAGIYELVRGLPNGFDTVVGSQGFRFSGGQRQRMSLARVLLKQPRVVVLDEATAHLDADTERSVRQGLREHLAETTTIVIAHRLSTVLDADSVAVIDGGAIVEHGPPRELLRRGGRFAALFASSPGPDAEPATTV